MEQLPDTFLPAQNVFEYMWRDKGSMLLAGTFVTMSAVVTGPIQDAGATIVEAYSDCRPPSQASIKAVTEMFDAPRPEPEYTSTGRFARGRQRSEFEAAKEKELGIQMPKRDGQKLEAVGGLSPSVGMEFPFADYLAASREILDQANIPIHIGIPEDSHLSGSKQDTAETPTTEELESYSAKFQVMNLANMFAVAPLNLTTNIGIKGVALTAHGASNEKGFVGDWAGLALTDEGILIVDVLNAGEDYDVAPHELYHLVDVNGCDGNMHKDPGYAALNKNATYAGEWPLPPGFMGSQPKTFATVEKEYYEREGDKYDALKRKDTGKYCEIDRAVKKLTHDIEMTDPYDHSGVAEDKANNGRSIFDIYAYPDMLDPSVPVRRNKFLYLLARLNEKHPETVKYYALTADRPSEPIDCSKQK